MKTPWLVLLSLAFVGLSVSAARADDSDIFGAEIEPNVMILLDSSGSMDDEINTNPYGSSETYSGSYTSTKVYKQNSYGGWSVYKNTVDEVNSASARSALSSDGYWQGYIGGSRLSLRMGNYLNWLASSGNNSQKKIDIAKRVLKKLVQNVEGVRFGVMRFANNDNQGQGGGGMVAAIGTDVSTIVSRIDGIDPRGYTPLGEMLSDAGQYYQGSFGSYASPIQYECQPNFAILISDGLQNGTKDARTEATKLYTTDYSATFAGKQNVILHTVGFAIDAGEKDAANDVLQKAARNGGGTFYYSDDEQQLEAALEDAIRQIVAATFAFATPVIPTTSATGVNRAYLAAFQSDPSRPAWRGYLKAYQRDANGQVPVDANGVPLVSALVWEAGDKLANKAASGRMIYTYVNGSRQEFRTTTSDLTASLLGVASDTEKNRLIDYIRGLDTYDEDADGNTTEERAWKLGDIFHSTPALITPPISPSADASYIAFRSANASRTTMLYAGSNDGMLHAFRESDGEELWAFIPPNVLGNLKTLTVMSADHPFFVDAGPVATDVKIGGAWKTVLVFGERRGGKAYYALDITDPSNPAYLWSFTEAKLGETWSEPAIAKVQMADGTVKWVAFVGGGYDTAQNNNSGKVVFAIDVATGAKLWEYYNAAGSTDDRRYMNFSLAANPAAADLNGDGYADRLYIGDVGGQLWKFDLSTPATLSGGLVSNWTGKRLFTASPAQANPPATGEYYPAQAFYATAVPAFDDKGNLWVYIGTGDRNHPNNTAQNRFYAIKDNVGMTNGSALTESSLLDVTSTNGTVTQGWYVRVGTSEKVLASADVFNKIVYFSTFTPTTTSACGSGGGTAKLYAVQQLTGYAAVDWSSGTALASSNATLARAKTIGTGIPSRPIMVITESGATLTTSVIAATTSQQLPSNPAPPPNSMRRVLYWREAY
jgi:type IV pilus assembly protein PilY1